MSVIGKKIMGSRWICLLSVWVLCTAVEPYQGCAHYGEVERTEEFDEIYYTLLGYFEEEKGELSDYCIWHTRNMNVTWKYKPDHIGHSGSKPRKKWCGISLDDRLRGSRMIGVMLHEMTHILYWCHIPKEEWTEKAHGDDMVWANGGGDFEISKFCDDPSIEIGKVKKDTILFKAAFELACSGNHPELMEWSRSEDRRTDMRFHGGKGEKLYVRKIPPDNTIYKGDASVDDEEDEEDEEEQIEDYADDAGVDDAGAEILTANDEVI